MCPAVEDPVYWQPPMPTCQTWMYCAQVMLEAKTYSNSCEMTKAGAKLLYKWKCSSEQINCPMYDLAVPPAWCKYENIIWNDWCSKPILKCESTCKWSYYDVVWPVWNVYPNPSNTKCNTNINWTSAYETDWNKQKVATCTCN